MSPSVGDSHVSVMDCACSSFCQSSDYEADEGEPEMTGGHNP